MSGHSRWLDHGGDHYERRYKERVIKQLHRRAAEFGFTPQDAVPEGVS
jgi:transposase